MLNAPAIGRLNLGTRLSGAWGWRKLTPCIATGIPPSDSLGHHRLAASAEYFHALRHDEFARNPRLGVVIAAHDEGPNPCLVQPPQLRGEEQRRLHRRLVAIVEVAGDHERVHRFVEAQIDDVGERLAGGVAEQPGEIGVAQRQRAQRRVEMDIGRVDEAEGHGSEGFGRRHVQTREGCANLFPHGVVDGDAAFGAFGPVLGLEIAGHSHTVHPRQRPAGAQMRGEAP